MENRNPTPHPSEVSALWGLPSLTMYYTNVQKSTLNVKISQEIQHSLHGVKRQKAIVKQLTNLWILGLTDNALLRCVLIAIPGIVTRTAGVCTGPVIPDINSATGQ